MGEKHYSFESFLRTRDALNDVDNPFLQQLFSDLFKKDWYEMGERVKLFSEKTSYKWRQLTKEIARPENHPTLRHYNAYNERVDEIIRPLEAIQLSDEVFSEGLFSSQQSKYEGIIKRYFLSANGEAGVTCPIACTDGLIALIETFYDEVSDEVQEIYRLAKEGQDGRFAVGAQFMSEIQGGSNIPANELKAIRQENGTYKLYGNKFFCSAVHADYAVVTAKIEDKEQVSVFIVPSFKECKRNHYQINRLKWKLGTTELASGEIDYQGAIAYPVGPLDKGVANAVSIVLTRSRLDIGFSSAAFVMRAAREARLYARFRQVFDRRIDEFPMAALQLDELEEAAKRMTTTSFHIYKQFANIQQLNEIEQFAIRELILLQKIYASKEAVEQLRLAISIFGGHGAIEDFSDIPRLFRDAMVNELWEGPRNVLLAQIYRDIHRFSQKFSLEDMLRSMFNHLTENEVDEYAERLKNIMAINLIELPNEKNKQAAKQWELLWQELFVAYQYEVTRDLINVPILSEDACSSF